MRSRQRCGSRAAVKAGDDDQVFSFKAEEKTAWKFAQAGSMNVVQHNWKLVRVFSHSVQDNFKLSAKTHPQTQLLCFIPIVGVKDFGARRRREDVCITRGSVELTQLATVPKLQLGLGPDPRWRVAVLAHFAGCGQGNLGFMQAIPELFNQRQALFGAEPGNLIRAKELHGPNLSLSDFFFNDFRLVLASKTHSPAGTTAARAVADSWASSVSCRAPSAPTRAPRRFCRMTPATRQNSNKFPTRST
jgi:hypothetical protein